MSNSIFKWSDFGEAYNSASGTSYFLGLTTTNLYFNVANIRIIRYSGFFDEPGTFALFSLFAILLNRIYFKNSKIEIWLISVTIFTLSLAFYFTISVYFILFYLKKSSFKYLIIILTTIGISISYIKNNTDNETISKLYDLTLKRFEIDESGLKGNNRAEASKLDKNIFYQYPILGTGSATNKVQGSNLYSVFARYGIFGSFFYYAFIVYFFLLLLRTKKQQRYLYLKILFLILLNFYHRPEMSSVFTLLVFVSIIFYLKNDVLNSICSSQEGIQNQTCLTVV